MQGNISTWQRPDYKGAFRNIPPKGILGICGGLLRVSVIGLKVHLAQSRFGQPSGILHRILSSQLLELCHQALRVRDEVGRDVAFQKLLTLRRCRSLPLRLFPQAEA